MNETEIILGGCIGLIAVLVIITSYRKRREQRQKKIAIQVEKVRRANEPGYQPPGRKKMWTTIEDGVISYRKDKTQKDKDKSGR